MSSIKELAQWERDGKLLAVVTQNIDGLHQKAGSRNVFELHGSVHRNTCQKCGARYTLAQMLTLGDVPKCPKCGGRVKPDVVLYEEGLDPLTISRGARRDSPRGSADRRRNVADGVPAAAFLDEYPGNRLVLINKTATPRDDIANLALHEKLGEVLKDYKNRPSCLTCDGRFFLFAVIEQKVKFRTKTRARNARPLRIRRNLLLRWEIT